MVRKKRAKAASQRGAKPVIGWRERVDLPALKVFGLRAKIDTGAKTSSLHVDEVSVVDRAGAGVNLRVTVTGTDARGVERAVCCDVRSLGTRRVKSSTGHMENRHVIMTALRLGGQEYPIEITLSDRSDMKFPMLIGRTALSRRFLVDCGRSFLQSSARRHSPAVVQRKLRSKE